VGSLGWRVNVNWIGAELTIVIEGGLKIGRKRERRRSGRKFGEGEFAEEL
jgi:hypothetical protein